MGHNPLSPFSRATYLIPGKAITGLPVKQAGIALPDPTQTTRDNWMASCFIIGHLVAELRSTAEFRSGDHEKKEIRRRHAAASDMELGEAWATASKKDS